MISLAAIKSDTFLLVWNLSSAITFVLPLFAFTVARLTSEQDYDQSEDNDENNYYDNPYQNPDNYDEYGNYVGPTHWWQFWKRNNNNQYNDDGNNSNDERMSPWWYIWGEREGEGEGREEEGSGSVLFIYLWTMMFFAGLFYLGNTTGMTISNLQGFRWALLGFANYCFVTIVLLVGLENAIETDGREIEETGFYGQRSVLLLVTCFFAMVQSIAYFYWTTKRLALTRANELIEQPSEYLNADFDAKNRCIESNEPAGFKI